VVNGRRLLRAGVALAAVATASLFAQERWGRRGDLMRTPTRIEANAQYDGQFTFVRLNYTTMPGGFWYRNQPAWSHGYPVAERNLMRILDALSTLAPKVDQVNSFSLEDPEIFRYPVLYIIEVGWWDMTDAEAAALRAYLDKGGFVIVDDFKMPGGIGGGGWDHFADNMSRVLPEGRFIDLDATHPIFHSFFDIHSLEIVPQAYNAGRPVFRGLYEDNDTTKPLRMIVNYNTDISQFWEWSERGFRSVDDTNEAYKLGVNSILYGLMH
jgi:hypothetical protein